MGGNNMMVQFMVIMVISILLLFSVGSYAANTVDGYKDRIGTAVRESELGGFLTEENEETEIEATTVEGIVEMIEETLEGFKIGGN